MRYQLHALLGQHLRAGCVVTNPAEVGIEATPVAAKSTCAWLRRSILGVGAFAFAFGILWRQDDYIFMFMAVTGAIFLGGAGICIVGGLYWKRGTTAGAWTGNDRRIDRWLWAA